MGAASHEERLQGFKDTIAEYPDIEIVDEQRDNDAVEKAISITGILASGISGSWRNPLQ